MEDTPGGGGPVLPSISIEEEMKSSYLDYAMSVIVSRALPDVRDGLKPVHRRILYSMHENGYTHDKPYRKSARVVGDVIGKYHPHGDQAIYDALVRMAQDFSMRLPLLDGQGNFGSMDGDPAAAMRYTEVRMDRPAEALLADIDKDTVDFTENYDNTVQEPVVLPARYPNLLVNGAGGIAVGMATNIPPHNLGEVVSAALALLENADLTIEDIIDIMPGPDFPTGAMIMGRGGIRNAYHTGRGSVIMRAKTHVEEVRSGREAIIVTEMPYQVNKSRMIEHIADLVRNKKVEGLSDIRDESDRDGVRVVLEVKRDASPEVVLSQLYRFTQLQTTFGVNMVALDAGRPKQMTVKDVLAAFLLFREQVITRRTRHLLQKARERAHVLVGLAVAVANIDEIIRLIRSAPDPATAREKLMERHWPAREVESLIRLIDEPGHRISEDGTFKLSENQARAILELRLHRLTALERDKIGDELKALGDKILDYLDILSSRERLTSVIRSELEAVREEFPSVRRTEIVEGYADLDEEDLIEREDMVVTMSYEGYVKRVPLNQYRAQRRGGKGRSGMATRDEDFVSQIYVVNTHTPVLFFTNRGMAYKMKVWRLPPGTPQSRGKAAINILPLDQGETITTILPLPEDEATWDDMFVVFSTSSGYVRRNRLSDFTNVKSNGKIAMKLEEGDRLVGVDVCEMGQDMMLSTRMGKAIRFPIDDDTVRVFAGRNSIGVRGIRLAEEDEVISMTVLNAVTADTEERDEYLRIASAIRRGEAQGPVDVEGAAMTQERFDALATAEQFVLTVTAKGYGKRTSAYDYRVTNRGGKGIDNLALTRKNGEVVASFPITEDEQLILVSNGGQLIRLPVDGIRIAARKTQGVILFKTAEDEEVVSVSRLDVEEEEGSEAEATEDTAADEAGVSREAGSDETQADGE